MWPETEKYPFLREKLRVLRDFGVRLTEEQREMMYELKSEVRADNFFRKIIVQALETTQDDVELGA